MNIGVLVSGRGSNLMALLRAFPSGHPRVHIAAVVSNRPDCAALSHARAAGILAHAVARTDHPSRRAQQATMATLLTDAGVELVVLAGFDQILTTAVLDPFAGRIINVHPSLLPAFGGTLQAQAAALAYGAKVSGCTVHYVTETVDEGPIIAQTAVPVLENDDVESLAQRIVTEEHRLLPWVVELIAEGRTVVEGRRVRIKEGAADASLAKCLR